MINSRLAAVFDQNISAPNEHALGYLTSENRDTWADLRTHLLSLGNTSQMEVVDSALFAVCLDDGATYDESRPVELIREGLFDNAGNRWYDKSFSLLIAADGTTSVNFEHSWGDGVAVMRYCNDVRQEVTNKPFVTDAETSQSSGGVGEHVRKIGKSFVISLCRSQLI